MLKDSSAALLLHTISDRAIRLTARKDCLPPKSGRSEFSFCFDAKCSITSGEKSVFAAWKGFYWK